MNKYYTYYLISPIVLVDTLNNFLQHYIYSMYIYIYVCVYIYIMFTYIHDTCTCILETFEDYRVTTALSSTYIHVHTYIDI